MAEDDKTEATLPLTRSGPAQAATPIFAPGERVAERYRIVRLVGEGGMGEVYEAEDLLLRERVALKTIRHEAARDEQVVERFKREIQLARRVTHPNVCRIFDVGLHRNDAFLTMELLEGETLAERIARSGRLSVAEAGPIVEQVAGALDAAHRAGVVHRDLKSANVVLVGQGAPLRSAPQWAEPTGAPHRAVVTDFGLACCAGGGDPNVTGDGGVVGSPSYMAPEQVEGREIGAAADLYALGVVMYEMVTGRVPFVGPTPLATAVMRLTEPPLTPSAHVTGLDPAWEQAILAAWRAIPPPGRRARARSSIRSRSPGRATGAARAGPGSRCPSPRPSRRSRSGRAPRQPRRPRSTPRDGAASPSSASRT